MIYLGIDRGDGRTLEQKAAAENMVIGYGPCGWPVCFFCKECGENGSGSVKHKPGCKTGKVLEGK